MRNERQLLDTIAKADNTTSHARPGLDDYALGRALQEKMKALIPEQHRVSIDIVRTLSAAGINAARTGFHTEAARWFHLARSVGDAASGPTQLALLSCSASAEAYLYSCYGDHARARAMVQMALAADLSLEQDHGWKFLLPQRIHYSHLLARVFMAEGDHENAFNYSLPGATGIPGIPTTSAIVNHANEFPEDHIYIGAALRRMAGEFAIASCRNPAEVIGQKKVLLDRTADEIISRHFAEVMEMIDIISSPDRDRMAAFLLRGRGATICWYAMVYHAMKGIHDQQIRTAIAMRTARWTDIPVPIRQAILEAATEAVPDFSAGEP